MRVADMRKSSVQLFKETITEVSANTHIVGISNLVKKNGCILLN